METRRITYSDGNTDYLGELYWEAGDAPRPGIVVFPEAFGLNDHARERARRLAAIGYVAFAADLHGGGAILDSMEALGPRMQALFADRTLWRAMAGAALDTLAAQAEADAGKLGAIGFCFGGATCLELARSGAALAGIASFHGGLKEEIDGDAGRIRASVLVLHGAEDPLLGAGTIDAVMTEFRRDQVDWQFTYYGNALHSFTDPEADTRGMDGLAYDARTEARSWNAMAAFFDELFN
ncbi:dienelactone hydrolase family protein [Mangrovimicrobium sediminis]|uniref:Dienelactone hydrolase family protein n=1 Tax=Mangrovimicrobium sediminis TaxID=2562682 RepID=A0A4Z0LYR0_9GAMM|nr:dienelactone hydrolase family protein [Haliea sp. SAOS-164]TGD72306.1 dienelactone hydrolase family protein [Haliea sp. SAOS-164]